MSSRRPQGRRTQKSDSDSEPQPSRRVSPRDTSGSSQSRRSTQLRNSSKLRSPPPPNRQYSDSESESDGSNSESDDTDSDSEEETSPVRRQPISRAVGKNSNLRRQELSSDSESDDESAEESETESQPLSIRNPVVKGGFSSVKDQFTKEHAHDSHNVILFEDRRAHRQTMISFFETVFLPKDCMVSPYAILSSDNGLGRYYILFTYRVKKYKHSNRYDVYITPDSKTRITALKGDLEQIRVTLLDILDHLIPDHRYIFEFNIKKNQLVITNESDSKFQRVITFNPLSEIISDASQFIDFLEAISFQISTSSPMIEVRYKFTGMGRNRPKIPESIEVAFRHISVVSIGSRTSHEEKLYERALTGKTGFELISNTGESVHVDLFTLSTFTHFFDRFMENSRVADRTKYVTPYSTKILKLFRIAVYGVIYYKVYSRFGLSDPKRKQSDPYSIVKFVPDVDELSEGFDLANSFEVTDENYYLFLINLIVDRFEQYDYDELRNFIIELLRTTPRELKKVTKRLLILHRILTDIHRYQTPQEQLPWYYMVKMPITLTEIHRGEPYERIRYRIYLDDLDLMLPLEQKAILWFIIDRDNQYLLDLTRTAIKRHVQIHVADPHVMLTAIAAKYLIPLTSINDKGAKSQKRNDSDSESDSDDEDSDEFADDRFITPVKKTTTITKTQSIQRSIDNELSYTRHPVNSGQLEDSYRSAKIFFELLPEIMIVNPGASLYPVSIFDKLEFNPPINTSKGEKIIHNLFDQLIE